MAQFTGRFTCTPHASEEVRSHYETHDLKHEWGDYQNYVNMDDDKRSAIDKALDAEIVERMGSSDLDSFIKTHPHMEVPENAAAMARYFAVKWIRV